MNFSNAVKAVLATAAMLSASAGAAPILSESHISQSSSRGAVGSGTAGVQAPLFSNMRLNGGQTATVAFIGEDNSILIGHYSRGPWSKAEFLRSWQNGGGNGNNGSNGNGSNGNGNNGNGSNGSGNDSGGGGRGDFLPPVESVTSLPEPSTFALLAFGLLALAAMRRRQTNR